MSSATHHDAEIVMKLYDLRREEVMRQARKFMAFEFWPRSIDDVLEVTNAAGMEKNAYFRQVISFCEMATTLPLYGAVHNELFTEWNREILFVFAKLKPLLPAIREKVNPNFLGNTERWINSSPKNQEILAAVEKRVTKMQEARAGR
jgi:hypothetical protein